VPYRAAASTTRLAWVLVLATVGSSQMNAGFGVAAAVGLVVFLLLLVGGYQVVYYRRFEYRLTGDTFDIDSGVLSRRSREIPYRRIQNVDVRRNPVQRALGIAEVRIETAGGGETEAQLRYVSASAAERLQRELSRRKRGEPGEPAEEAGREPEPAEELYAVTPRELALLGVVNVDLRLLSIAAALLPIVSSSVSEQFPLASLLATAPLLFVALLAFAVAASSVAGVAAYWGFRLWRGVDELRYERGLLQRYTGTIPLEKIQAVRLSENALARLAGFAAVEVETAGYAPGESGGSQAAVPVARRDRALRLAREVEPFPDVAFERPPRRARTRYAARYALVVLALAAITTALVRFGPAVLAARSPVPGYAPLALLPLVPVAAHLKWRNLGYALLEDHVVTRAGFWTRTTYVVPYYRVQTVVESATVFQRRRRLATLLVDVAGSSGLTGSQPRALDVDGDRASELRETIERRLGIALVERWRRRDDRDGRRSDRSVSRVRGTDAD
jgi:putative membrane protein